MKELKQKLISLITNEGLRAYLVAMGWDKTKDYKDSSIWTSEASTVKPIYLHEKISHRELMLSTAIIQLSTTHNISEFRVIEGILNNESGEASHDAWYLLHQLLDVLSVV